jgi:hypothetical protein
MQTAGASQLREDERYGREGRADLRLVEPDRRTVRITGQPMPPRRHRSARQEQLVARPDRVALWAFLLAVFLLLVAAATAHSAVF